MSQREIKGNIPKNGAIVKSIVTGDLSKVIGEKYGVKTIETLTGFKHICGKANEFDRTGEHTFIFGYEESIGKVYENLMVDVLATNEKLVDRAKRIIVEATGVEYEEAERVFEEAESVKLAIVMILSGASKEDASKALEETNGFVRDSIQNLIS